MILDGKTFAADRLAEKNTSVKGKQIDCGTPVQRMSMAATSRC